VDLNTIPWPWETSAIQEILAEDALEHLCPLGPGAGNFNIPHLMKEIYRVLEPGGIINIKVPSTDGRGAWQDPTHITFWNLNSFSYMDPRSPLHGNFTSPLTSSELKVSLKPLATRRSFGSERNCEQ
jgi:SAM-dependent methyltransferase